MPAGTAPPEPSRAVANGAPILNNIAGWMRQLFPRRQAANPLPGRGYVQVPGSLNQYPAEGGARGPASIPSRLVTPVVPPPPATAGGQYGPSATTRRGPVLAVPGRSPSLQNIEYDSELLHNTIAWSRPRYENAEGLEDYRPPTQQPNWTYDTALQALRPVVPIPVQQKSIASFTTRKPFGDNSRGTFSRASYGKVSGVPIKLPYYGMPGSPTYPTPSWMVRRPQVGNVVQKRRWRSQAQWRNPVLYNLSRWGQAGSFGQTTPTLPTQPTNVPAASATAYGPY
jgi:hypothetical protein